MPPNYHDLRERCRHLHGGLVAWCRERNGWVRLPLVAYLVWFLIAHVSDPAYWSLAAWLNLGVHEIGHIVTRPCGQFISIAGGSTMQCLLPVVGMVMFVRQNDWFAVPVALVWLGDNICNVAWYCADAQNEDIPLVKIGGGEVIHDWHYLLDATGLLDHTDSIAFLMRWTGLGVLALGVAGATYVTWLMIRPGRAAA